MKYFNLKDKKGFTLVEMMVAIAVFSIVMVTAMSALLNVIDANNKARSLKTAVNNISFALDGISKDMRVGTDYKCGTVITSMPSSVALECTNDTGGKIIGYRSPRADLDGSGNRKYAYYRFKSPQIEECLEKGSVVTCADGDFNPITSGEVTLTKTVFRVLGVESPDVSTTQPRMIITVSGEAGAKEKIKTRFDLQTSVSQRIRP